MPTLPHRETDSVHVDTIRPTVEITGVPEIPQKDPFDLKIVFSEAVNGFTLSDLTVLPAPADDVATIALTGDDGDSEYTLTITPTPNFGRVGDILIFPVGANIVKDLAGNNNVGRGGFTIIYIDTVPPTVEISNVPEVEKNGTFNVRIGFSEEVSGFDLDQDLTLTGPATATPEGTPEGNRGFEVIITPNPGAEGEVTLKVNAGVVTDEAGNGNSESLTRTVHVDTIVPTVSVSGFPPATPERNGPFTLTATFSEPVNGFAVPAGLTLTGPVTATLASGTEGASVYTITITPNATSEGDVTVTVNANAVQDFALNGNTASPETDSVHVDTIPPTVSVAVTPPTVGAETGYETEERNTPYDLTVTFSEPVNGFAVSEDLTVTGPGTAALTDGAEGDSVYTVTITPTATSEGDVAVTVNPNTIVDFATNPNPTGASTVTTHIDTIAPTVAILDTPALQRRNNFFDIRIVFNEPINDFRVPDDFTLPQGL